MNALKKWPFQQIFKTEAWENLSHVGKTCEKILVLKKNRIFSQQQKFLPNSGRIILKRVGNTGERREAAHLAPPPLEQLFWMATAEKVSVSVPASQQCTL